MSLNALRSLPETRVLTKILRYLSQLPYTRHPKIVSELLDILDKGMLPFPFQIAAILESIKTFGVADPSLAVKIRRNYTHPKNDWLVRQKALEAIMTLPYASRHALSLAQNASDDDHPGVRRAACLLMTRAPYMRIRSLLGDAAYSVDQDVSRLGLFYLKHVEHRNFGLETVAKLRSGDPTGSRFISLLGTLSSVRCNIDPEVRRQFREVLDRFAGSRNEKVQWFVRIFRGDIDKMAALP